MATDAERLRFALSFAQMDLDALRPGDWLNLAYDLGAFLAGSEFERWAVPTGGEIFWHDTGGIVAQGPEWSQEALRALQPEVRALLGAVARPQTASETMAAVLRTPPDTAIAVQTRVVSLKALAHPRSRNILVISGAPRDVFLFMLQLLLVREPASSILVCPECGTLFYRIGKQHYCSRPCSNRAAQRQWRQRQEVQAHQRDKAHQRYARKKQPARVSRRPRKRSADNAETSRQS